MPTYTVRSKSNSKEWDIQCSWDELQDYLDKHPDTEKVLSTPKIVTGVGSLHGKVPSGFKDKLNQIKKGSGRNNTIRT